MSKQLVSISKAADELGVCIDTLREWDKSGQLVPVLTAGKHRRYRVSDIEKMRGEFVDGKPKNGQTRVAIYQPENKSTNNSRNEVIFVDKTTILLCLPVETLQEWQAKGLNQIGGYTTDELLNGLNENASKMDK